MRTLLFILLLITAGARHFSQAQSKKSSIKTILNKDTTRTSQVGALLEFGSAELVKGVDKLNERLRYLSLPGINSTLKNFGLGVVIDREKAMFVYNYKYTTSSTIKEEVNYQIPHHVILSGHSGEFRYYRALIQAPRFRAMAVGGTSLTRYKLTLVDGGASNSPSFDGLFSNAATTSSAVIESKDFYMDLMGGIGLFYRNKASRKTRWNIGADLSYAFPIGMGNGWKQQYIGNANVTDVPSLKMDALTMRLLFIMSLR